MTLLMMNDILMSLLPIEEYDCLIGFVNDGYKTGVQMSSSHFRSINIYFLGKRERER